MLVGVTIRILEGMLSSFNQVKKLANRKVIELLLIALGTGLSYSNIEGTYIKKCSVQKLHGTTTLEI